MGWTLLSMHTYLSLAGQEKQILVIIDEAHLGILVSITRLTRHGYKNKSPNLLA